MATADPVQNVVFAEILKAFQEYVPDIIIKQKRALFDSEGTTNGHEGWEPLSEKTIQIKSAMGAPQPAKILYRFGKLRASFEVSVRGTDDGIVISVVNDLPYADEMDDTRPFMHFTEEDLQEITSGVVEKMGIRNG